MVHYDTCCCRSVKNPERRAKASQGRYVTLSSIVPKYITEPVLQNSKDCHQSAVTSTTLWLRGCLPAGWSSCTGTPKRSCSVVDTTHASEVSHYLLHLLEILVAYHKIPTQPFSRCRVFPSSSHHVQNIHSMLRTRLSARCHKFLAHGL